MRNSCSELLTSRVSKASLEHLNRDQGRCEEYGPEHALTVEFDDEYCIVLSVVCQYKFGKLKRIKFNFQPEMLKLYKLVAQF